MWISHRLSCAPGAAAAGMHQSQGTATKPINNSPVPFSQEFLSPVGAGQGSLPTLPSSTWTRYLHICIFVQQETLEQPRLAPQQPSEAQIHVSLPILCPQARLSMLRAGAVGVFQAEQPPTASLLRNEEFHGLLSTASRHSR